MGAALAVDDEAVAHRAKPRVIQGAPQLTRAQLVIRRLRGIVHVVPDPLETCSNVIAEFVVGMTH